MSAQITVFVSLDYEIFLGRNFAPPDEVLFGPAERIVEACDRDGIPVTVFADVCSVWAHRAHGRQDYAAAFEAQLCAFARRGHDAQLHVHPHWLYARPSGDGWAIDPSRMSLAELGFGPGAEETPAILRRGSAYLEQLLKPVLPKYRCVAFRAAGLALQPRERELTQALLNAGIVIDSSIVKNVHLKMDTADLDYRGAPASANWFIDPGLGLMVPAQAGLYEIPIGTFQLSWRHRLAFLARRAASAGRLRLRGTGISRSEMQTLAVNLWTLIRGNARYLAGNPWFILSCDTKGFSLEALLAGFDDVVERHRHERQIQISIINHPKLMFDAQLRLLRDFVRALRRRYGHSLSLGTYSEVATSLGTDHPRRGP